MERNYIDRLLKSVEHENAIIGALFTSTILDNQKVNILKENISSIIFRDDFNKQIINHILDLNMNIEHDLLSVEYSFTNKHGDKYGNALANLSERVRASNQSSFLSYIENAINEFKKERLSTLHEQKAKAIKDSDYALLMMIDEELAQLQNQDDEIEETDAHTDKDLSEIFGDNLLSQYAKYKSDEAQIPVNTTLVTMISLFSSIACRAFKVSYPNGDTQPLSIYSVCEQPVATSKSRIVKGIQAPIFNQTKDERKALTSEIDKIDDALEHEDIEPSEKAKLKIKRKKLTKAIESLFSFETDSTPEALDGRIKTQNGFFSIVSAEKQALNSIIGSTYGDSKGKVNKDALLKGFNGEYHSSSRAGREGFTGDIVGTVTVLAQSGMIDDLLQASGNTGVFERFIVWQEGHLLGKRKHSREFNHNKELENKLSALVLKIYESSRYEQDGIKRQKHYDDLNALHLSIRSWQFINARRDDMEWSLGDGEENSINIFRGLIGKIDIFIMKIASILHLFSDNAFNKNTIDDDLVINAFVFMKAYIEHLKSLVVNSGLMALSDRETAIMQLVERNPKGITAKKIIDGLYRRNCFIKNGKMIKTTVKDELESMILKGYVKVVNESESKHNISKAIITK